MIWFAKFNFDVTYTLSLYPFFIFQVCRYFSLYFFIGNCFWQLEINRACIFTYGLLTKQFWSRWIAQVDETYVSSVATEEKYFFASKSFSRRYNFATVLCSCVLWRLAFLVNLTLAWKVSKYGPEMTPYLDTFHAVLTHKKQMKPISFADVLTGHRYIPNFFRWILWSFEFSCDQQVSRCMVTFSILWHGQWWFGQF